MSDSLAARGVAVVTGCLGGIGQEIVRELRAARFVPVGIDLHEALDTEQPYYSCDLAQADALREVYASIRRDHGRVRLLVNNAAYYNAKEFLDVTQDEFDRTFDVNVRAAFLGTQIVVRDLIEAGAEGQIINIASVVGRIGSAITDYGASKSALIGMTKSLGKSLAKHGIRVNAVAPGLVDTDMGRRIPKAHFEKHVAATPLLRPAAAVEVARVVRFLASEDASYMTASIVDVNGGLY